MAFQLSRQWLGVSGIRSDAPEGRPDREVSLEEQWSEEAEARAAEQREDFNHALSGISLKHTRFTSDIERREREETKQKNEKLLIAALRAQAYQAAYNNEISLSVGGMDLRMKQGEAYDRFSRRHEELAERYEEARRGGASGEELEALARRRDLSAQAAEALDPANGRITEENRRLVEEYLRQDPELAAELRADGYTRESTANLSAPDASSVSTFASTLGGGISSSVNLGMAFGGAATGDMLSVPEPPARPEASNDAALVTPASAGPGAAPIKPM